MLVSVGIKQGSFSVFSKNERETENTDHHKSATYHGVFSLIDTQLCPVPPFFLYLPPIPNCFSFTTRSGSRPNILFRQKNLTNRQHPTRLCILVNPPQPPFSSRRRTSTFSIRSRIIHPFTLLIPQISVENTFQLPLRKQKMASD